MRAIRRSRTLILINALLIVALSLAARAKVPAEAPVEGQSFTGGLLSELFPEVKELPAPSWLKEGLRVYYRTSSGSLNKTESQSMASLSDTPLLKPDELSLSPFLLRTDVTAVASRKVTSYTTLFMDFLMVPWDENSETSNAGMGPFWMHTGLLKTAVGKQGLKQSELRWKILNEEYDAVRIDFDNTAATGNYYVWIVEKSTGLLLYTARISRPKAGGVVEMTAVEFYSMRYIAVPWTSYPVPTYAKQGFTLNYEGNIQSWSPKSGPGLSVPAMVQVKLDAIEDRTSFTSIKRIFSEAEIYEAKVSIGSAQLAGSFWLPTGYLSTLKEGQVIDRDSITNSVTEVSYVGKAKDGTNRIAIFEFGKNYKRAWIYRSSDGLLVYWMEDKIVDPMISMSQKSEWNLK